MLARSETVRHCVYQVDIEVSMPVDYSRNRMLNQSVSADENMLISLSSFYEENNRGEEHHKLLKLFSDARKNKADDRYQGRFLREPKTQSYYLNAVFTFYTIESAEKFVKTLDCTYEAEVYVSINIIPELMDIRSLYLDRQIEQIQRMSHQFDSEATNELEYLNTLSFIFSSAMSCLAGRIFTEKCFTIEENLYMLLGFRFSSIKAAKDFASRVTKK